MTQSLLLLYCQWKTDIYVFLDTSIVSSTCTHQSEILRKSEIIYFAIYDLAKSHPNSLIVLHCYNSTALINVKKKKDI